MPSVDHARPSHSATLFAPALPQEVLRVNVLGLVGPLESGLPHQPIRVPVEEEPTAFAGRAFMDRVLPRFGPEALVVGARLCFDPLAPQVLDGHELADCELVDAGAEELERVHQSDGIAGLVPVDDDDNVLNELRRMLQDLAREEGAAMYASVLSTPSGSILLLSAAQMPEIS